MYYSLACSRVHSALHQVKCSLNVLERGIKKGRLKSLASPYASVKTIKFVRSFSTQDHANAYKRQKGGLGARVQ
jgi:hypothetical protein